MSYSNDDLINTDAIEDEIIEDYFLEDDFPTFDFSKFHQDLDKITQNFITTILTRSISIEDKMGDIILHHFCKEDKVNEFQGIILPRLGFSHKVQILQQIMTKYQAIIDDYPTLIKDIKDVYRIRNAIAHRKMGWTARSTKAHETTITLNLFKDGENKTIPLDNENREKYEILCQQCHNNLQKFQNYVMKNNN